MTLSYTLTLADYKAAQRLHIRRKFSRRLAFGFWYIAIPVLAVLGAISFIAFDLYRITPEWAPLLFGSEAALVWFAIFLPVARAYMLRKSFKHIFPAGRTDRSSSIDIDEERVISAIPGVSEGKFFWNAIIEWAYDESITLLYIRPKRFLMIPMRAFSEEQRNELLGMLEQKGIKGGTC